MPDVAVRDKQVVVVRHEDWVQVKEVLQEGNMITLGLGLGGLQDEDMGIECNYAGEVSIDDDALGVVLSNKGQFLHNFQITKRIISSHTEVNITQARSFKTSCDLSNMATPIFKSKSNKLALNQMLIAKTENLSTSCCLSTTNILSSFGPGCPHSSREISQLRKQCVFSPFFQGRCNQVNHLRVTSRFCKSKNSFCVLQEYIQTHCVLQQQVLNLCDLENKICS